MKLSLKNISRIRFGLFSQEAADGDVIYLQGRQFDDSGNFIHAPDTFLMKDNKVKAHLLNDGDIILAGKGSRNFAWCYRSDFGPAVASSIFFVISPDTKKVIPEYLTAIFNLSESQRYFGQLGAGSDIQSIRKTDLEDFMVSVIDFALQKKVVTMSELHKNEIELIGQLVQRKNELYKTVINKIVN